MIIDRHNYEECFILYWDNELTASQKQAVENFVKTNPDLLEEFNILGETRFNPDHKIQFDEKEFLLNDSFINITNYEEQLLNYIDDELDADQRKEIERSASKNPAVQKELSLLLKTKLQPEQEIVFADKSDLYRHEEKVRVISMTWLRVAVAAVLILIAGFATLKLVTADKPDIDPTVAKANNQEISPSNEPATQPINNTVELTPEGQQEKLATLDKKSATEQKKPEATITKSENDLSNSQLAAENKNNLPQPKNNPAIIVHDNDPAGEAYAKVEMPNLTPREDTDAEKTQSGIINTPLVSSGVTLQAKPTLYIPEADEKENGGGIKEFLRKTTRVFERRTKIETTTDDNKLLVGAFTVSLK